MQITCRSIWHTTARDIEGSDYSAAISITNTYLLIHLLRGTNYIILQGGKVHLLGSTWRCGFKKINLLECCRADRSPTHSLFATSFKNTQCQARICTLLPCLKVSYSTWASYAKTILPGNLYNLAKSYLICGTHSKSTLMVRKQRGVRNPKFCLFISVLKVMLMPLEDCRKQLFLWIFIISAVDKFTFCFIFLPG